FADGLATGGTGGEAVVIGTFKVEYRSNMRGCRVQLLLGFAGRVKLVQRAALEGRGINAAVSGIVALRYQLDERMKILNTLAGAEIKAQSRVVDFRVVEYTGVGERLFGRGQRETCVH